MNPLSFFTKEKMESGRFSLLPIQGNITKGNNKIGMKDALNEYRKHARSINQSFRRMNPIAPGLADLVQWLLYDRTIFAQATTTPVNFKSFTIPQGQGTGIAGGAKTKTDTNMEQVQRLPDPLWMNVVAIGFYFANPVFKTDLDNFINNYYQEFWIGQKVYLEGPYIAFPSAAGIFGTTSENNQASWTNGVPRSDDMFDVRLPAGLNLGSDSGTGEPITTDGLIGLTILQGQQFKIENNAPGGGVALTAAATNPLGTGIDLMPFLYGILSRGVQ
jgi:hypothetical protein